MKERERNEYFTMLSYLWSWLQKSRQVWQIYIWIVKYPKVDCPFSVCEKDGPVLWENYACFCLNIKLQNGGKKEEKAIHNSSLSFFFFFSVALHSLPDLSCPTRNWTPAPWGGTAESQPWNCQGTLSSQPWEKGRVWVPNMKKGMSRHLRTAKMKSYGEKDPQWNIYCAESNAETGAGNC